MTVFWMTFVDFVQNFDPLFLAVTFIIQVYRVRFTKAFIHFAIKVFICIYLFL
jgi:hypothetical protein